MLNIQQQQQQHHQLQQHIVVVRSVSSVCIYPLNNKDVSQKTCVYKAKNKFFSYIDVVLLCAVRFVVVT